MNTEWGKAKDPVFTLITQLAKESPEDHKHQLPPFKMSFIRFEGMVFAFHLANIWGWKQAADCQLTYSLIRISVVKQRNPFTRYFIMPSLMITFLTQQWAEVLTPVVINNVYQAVGM